MRNPANPSQREPVLSHYAPSNSGVGLPFAQIRQTGGRIHLCHEFYRASTLHLQRTRCVYWNRYRKPRV